MCFICSIICYMTSIAHHLLGQTRSAVLSTLLLHPEDSLHVRELARRTGSDVDLMVLGRAGFADLARALAGAQAALRREVNPTVTTPREFRQKLAAGDGFARSVLKGPKLWLMGDESDFAELAAHRKA